GTKSKVPQGSGLSMTLAGCSTTFVFCSPAISALHQEFGEVDFAAAQFRNPVVNGRKDVLLQFALSFCSQKAVDGLVCEDRQDRIAQASVGSALLFVFLQIDSQTEVNAYPEITVFGPAREIYDEAFKVQNGLNGLRICRCAFRCGTVPQPTRCSETSQ